MITDVVIPSASAAAAGAPPLVVAEVGAGTGYLIHRLARALPAGVVIATDVEQGMRDFCAKRCADAGLTNVRVVTAGLKHAGLPLRAHAIVMLNTYHHIWMDSREMRIAWLRNTAALDLAPHGRIIIVEFSKGDLPVNAPPEWMRLERSDVIADAEAAGLSLVDAPSFLPYQHITVFERAAASSSSPAASPRADAGSAPAADPHAGAAAAVAGAVADSDPASTSTGDLGAVASSL